MANEHPFQILFETLGRLPASHADSVNRQAYDVLSDILTVPVERPGRCILLRAPRAGHGKTHLLSRIQHQLGSTHEFIPLHPALGSRIDALSVIDDVLRRLLRPLPGSGGLYVLDSVTRRLFARALQPLVRSGEVPCQDHEGALAALRTRPFETFDFHHPNAVTAHWARENFEVLEQRLSMELAQRCGLPIREISFWVKAMFHFAVTPVGNPGRITTLAASAQSVEPGKGMPMERLEALLGLLSLLSRVVLVADDLEGFSIDDTAAVRFAAFLSSLRQSVERIDVILSLNMDIWQSAFLPRLSGGLTDRLSEVVIELAPLTKAQMVALLDSRVPGLGDQVLERIDLNEAGTHARGLIRAAGIAWLGATAMDRTAVPVVHPGSATPATAAVVEKPEVLAVALDPAREMAASANEIPVPQPVSAASIAPESSPLPTVETEPTQIDTPAPPQSQESPPIFPPRPEIESENSSPPVDSPFQIAPSAVAFDLQLTSEAKFWNELAAESLGAPAHAQPTFHEATPAVAAPTESEFVPSRTPAQTPVPPTSPASPPPAEEINRVDELLRQFRERYGRGSL